MDNASTDRDTSRAVQMRDSSYSFERNTATLLRQIEFVQFQSIKLCSCVHNREMYPMSSSASRQDGAKHCDIKHGCNSLECFRSYDTVTLLMFWSTLEEFSGMNLINI